MYCVSPCYPDLLFLNWFLIQNFLSFHFKMDSLWKSVDPKSTRSDYCSSPAKKPRLDAEAAYDIEAPKMYDLLMHDIQQFDKEVIKDSAIVDVAHFLFGFSLKVINQLIFLHCGLDDMKNSMFLYISFSIYCQLQILMPNVLLQNFKKTSLVAKSNILRLWRM